MIPMKKIFPYFLVVYLLVFIAGTFIACLNDYRISPPSVETRVLRVVDGDTIVVNYQNRNEKIRFLCVDTPESVHHDETRNIPMGKSAADYTKSRIGNKPVKIETGEPLRDRYNRILAYVFVDDENFNVELVRKGWSPYYTKYGKSEKYDSDFQKAEEEAQREKLNIWGDSELTQKYLRLKNQWNKKGRQ